MIWLVLASFTLTPTSGPLSAALDATEAPTSLRAAFTVELTSDRARRTFSFDPRRSAEQRWQLLEATGEDSELDQVAAEWGAESAPDGRLFPDDLRASLSERVTAEDFGAAWRVRFRHTPSLNDNALDVWAAERLNAIAWLDPGGARFLRIDHELPRPVRGPEGGQLLAYRQTHLLETDPVWGFSYVTAISVAFEARWAVRRIERSYRAEVTEIELFFANAAAEAAFREAEAR